MADVHIIGIGKDAYHASLNQMVDGNHLPWLEDSSADGYPVWSSWSAQQRSIFILNREGAQDTTFNMTPFTENDPSDYTYLMHQILFFRNSGGSQTIKIPQDASEIQTGINMSQDGDLILIDSGTYFEHLNLLGKSITIASLYFHRMSADYIEETIIDGQGAERIITIEGGESGATKIIGLSITNGSASVGSGLYISNGSSPTIEKNNIFGNHGIACGAVGGGMAIFNESNPKIIGNRFENNSVSGPCDCICYFGGGIYVDSTSFPIVGGEIGMGNIFDGNNSDYGQDLFRQVPIDTSGMNPINARFNTFDHCPPEFIGDVYPEYGWDVTNCTPILSVDNGNKPNTYTLFSAYPNPFNGKVTLSYKLEESQQIRIHVFDLSGKLVDKIFSGKVISGDHFVSWDAENYSSGVYIVQLNFNDVHVSQKILLLK